MLIELIYYLVLTAFPRLSNINGRTESTSYNHLEVSFLKWNLQMIGDTPPDTYVYLYYLERAMFYLFYFFCFKNAKMVVLKSITLSSVLTIHYIDSLHNEKKGKAKYLANAAFKLN